jgi:hypothetical protein
MADTIDTVDLSVGVSDNRAYKKVSDLSVYDFMTQTYRGSGIYRDGTGLIPHSREMDYKSRRENAFFKNYLRPILRAMVEPCFAQQAVRTVTDDAENEQTDTLLNAFLENADNDGGSIQDVVELVITQARLHGLAFAVIDNYSADALSPTVAENIANRTFPYVYLRKATQVKAYELDRFGKLARIAFYDVAPASEKLSLTSEKKVTESVEYIREWDFEKSQLYKKEPKDAKFVPAGPAVYHGLGKLPVLVVYSVKRDDKNILYVDPPLFDIAKLNFTLYNKDSEIREIERAQGFSFLYAQGIEPGDLTIGVHNYLNLPEKSTIPPGYCSPDPNIQKTLMENSGAIREAIFQIAEQNGVTGVTDQSGVAKQWDFFAHESILQHTSKLAEILENQIVEIFQQYTETDWIYTVEYKTDFQPNSVLHEIEEYERYLDLQPASKGQALAKGNVARLVFRAQPQEVIAEIVEQEMAEADEEKQSKALETEEEIETVE